MVLTAAMNASSCTAHTPRTTTSSSFSSSSSSMMMMKKNAMSFSNRRGTSSKKSSSRRGNALKVSSSSNTKQETENKNEILEKTMTPLEIMDDALKTYGDDIAIAFSGAEDVALIQYAHLTNRPYRVFSLDTGRLNPETYELFDKVEKHFNISASGAISLSDASDPSPARLKEIQERITNESIHCVLAEPQFNDGIVKAIVAGTDANTTVIDPLGVGLEVGPSFYNNLIRNLGARLSNCF